MRELIIIILNKGGNCNSQFPTKQGKLDERSLSNDKRGLGFFSLHLLPCTNCKPSGMQACTHTVEMKKSEQIAKKREGTLPRGLFKKNTNSYSPSKAEIVETTFGGPK